MTECLKVALRSISCSLVTAAVETIGPGVTVRVSTLETDNECYCDISPLLIIITIYSLALSEEAFVTGALGKERPFFSRIK